MASDLAREQARRRARELPPGVYMICTECLFHADTITLAFHHWMETSCPNDFAVAEHPSGCCTMTGTWLRGQAPNE